MSKITDDQYQYEQQPRLILNDGRQLVVWPPSLKEDELVWIEPGHSKYNHRLLTTREAFKALEKFKPKIKTVTIVYRKQGDLKEVNEDG